jgi:hypothetical protein
MDVSANGPEWMEGPDGPEVLALSRQGVPIRAAQARAGWVPQAFAQTGVAQPFGSLVPGDPLPWVRSLQGVPRGQMWLQRADGVDAVLPFPTIQGRWTPGQHELVFVSKFDARHHRVGRWTPAEGFEVLDVGTGTTSHRHPMRVDVGGRELLVVGEGMELGNGETAANRIAVYEHVGDSWERTETLWPPPGLRWLEAPVPFVWNDRAYVAFAASSAPWGERDDYVMLPWVMSVDGQQPPVHQPACGLQPQVARDTEVFTGGVEPWLYYTLNRRRRTLRRCTLALP